jgi:formylglycine-generating enzyme required for sulfatase activity
MRLAETNSLSIDERRRGALLLIPDEHHPEKAPIHRAVVDGFWMDRAPVINRHFRAFVEQIPSPRAWRDQQNNYHD